MGPSQPARCAPATRAWWTWPVAGTSLFASPPFAWAAKLGTEVEPALSRKDLADPLQRPQGLIDTLVKTGAFDGGLRIPNAVGPVQITVEFRASRITAYVDIPAPAEVGVPPGPTGWYAS